MRGVQCVPKTGPIRGLGALLDLVLFAQNDSCGYVLKPRELTEPFDATRFKDRVIDITISVRALIREMEMYIC